MLTLSADRYAMRNVLDGFPMGIGVWYTEPFSCVLNRDAMQLTGFSDGDFQRNESLWLSRVDPRDRTRIATARQRLRTERKKVSCDYRFFPNGSTEEIWLRDVSLPFQNPAGKIRGILSAYTDISGLMSEIEQSTQARGDLAKVVERLAHDVRNDLHVICGTLEFLQMAGPLPAESRGMVTSVEAINRLVGELEEYCSPPNAQLSTADPIVLLQDVVLRMRDELLRRRIHLKWVHPDALPDVRLDLRQIRRAIQRVLDFSVAVLPDGGELNIEARRQEVDGAPYVELKIMSSPYALDINEKEVFQPFLEVRKYKAGLSLALARETLYRNRGQITFRKNNSEQALFSLLLEAHSDH